MLKPRTFPSSQKHHLYSHLTLSSAREQRPLFDLFVYALVASPSLLAVNFHTPYNALTITTPHKNNIAWRQVVEVIVASVVVVVVEVVLSSS